MRSPFPLIPRIEGFSVGQPPMSMVGALCCTTRSHKQQRQDRFCPPLPTPGVTIYRSHGAYQGQGTIVETLAGWSAAVWSADARGLGAGVAFATARGFLGNVYSNNQAESFALLQCFVSSASLAGSSRYF